MPGDVDVEFDVAQLNQALLESERDMLVAGSDLVTANARTQLKHVVDWLPVRSGNLRSSATYPWQRLGLPGRPKTTVRPGVKYLEYRIGSREKVNKFVSWGDVWDNRGSAGLIRYGSSSPDPSFKYALYAAEWRERRATPGALLEMMRGALRAGMMTPKEFATARKMMFSGPMSEWQTNWRWILQELNFHLARFPGLSKDGYWHYYGYYAGLRRRVTGKLHFKFTNEYRKSLEQHSGR